MSNLIMHCFQFLHIGFTCDQTQIESVFWFYFWELEKRSEHLIETRRVTKASFLEVLK